ncbi:MAG TPA: hypothetical protein VIT38_01585 [Allosphingosinicella sp.]|jgi:hypothetical protein
MNRLLLAAAAALAFGAAGSPAFAQTGDVEGGDMFGNAQQALSVDEEFLIGRWTDDGNCGDAVEFAEDGVFHTPEGAVGSWSLNGDRLTVSGTGTLTMRIVPVDDDTIDVINPDGGQGRSTRCEAADDVIGGTPLLVT